MAPDVESLLRALDVPGFRYREAQPRPLAPRRAAERAPRAGVTILALVSLVRGVGRTTVAANLATALGRRGLRAAAVDLDPAASLRAHFAQRLGALPSGAEIEWAEPSVGYVPHLDDHASAVEAAWDCDAVIVDTAAGASDAVEQALAEADEVVVVVRPDPQGLDSVRPTEALLARCRMRSWRRSRARYLVNRFDGRRAVDRGCMEVLRRLLGPRLLWPLLQDDVAAGQALASGQCIEDYAPGSQLVADLQSLSEALFPSRKDAP